MLLGEERGKYLSLKCKDCDANARVKGYCVTCYNRRRLERSQKK